MQILMMLLVVVLLTAPSVSAYEAETVRRQEINQCLPGELMTWGDGRDRPVSGPINFRYDHSGAPPWFAENQVILMVGRAAEAWSQCGVKGSFVSGLVSSGAVLVQWSEKESRGNFGLADLGNRRLSLSAAMFGLLKSRNPRYDSTYTLQMTISHEMGHFFGLMDHSRRCVDVVSYYTVASQSCYTRAAGGMKGVPEYRHLFPTACDIERCRAVNKQPPLSGGRLPR